MIRIAFNNDDVIFPLEVADFIYEILLDKQKEMEPFIRREFHYLFTGEPNSYVDKEIYIVDINEDKNFFIEEVKLFSDVAIPKCEGIQKYIVKKIIKYLIKPVNEIKKGFLKIVDEFKIKSFESKDELKQKIFGDPNLDVCKSRSLTRVVNNGDEERCNKTKEYFWNYLERCTSKKRKEIFKYWTAQSNLLSAYTNEKPFSMKIGYENEVDNANGELLSYTCFKRMNIPCVNDVTKFENIFDDRVISTKQENENFNIA
ncbi:E3 ubiquitin-protein ligase SMURF2 [Astathelohania contejeani]|uniref:E3 ubiquitin-protein ligase SMURF2 n=1 Tax=Astathelohania contejeani TaxID=164912 RepID=A0ABQ7HV68_9MICR|nr:E3 ubiquitin-protein ligase SMURF2 [Thelohania contejeani]